VTDTPLWLDDLEAGAPDIVAAYRGIEVGRFVSVRREARRRAGEGSVEAVVGRLRCGEWLLFAGVHDLMHLEQLHGIASRMKVGIDVRPG